jgi:hypothetical protein
MKKYDSYSAYRYYNCNPHSRRTDDCVIRAICSSTGDSWEDTMRALAEWSIKTGYMLSTPECYGPYLESIGYVKQKQPSQKDGKKVRFKDFCKSFDGHAICHCGKTHVTYVADNHVWDIWNTEDEIVGVYWVHEAEL